MVRKLPRYPPPFKFKSNYDPIMAQKWQDKHVSLSDDYHGHMREAMTSTGMSLSYAVDKLRDTHDLMFLQTHSDAVFVHKKLRGHMEKGYNSILYSVGSGYDYESVVPERHRIKFPVDEFICYKDSSLFFQFDPYYVRMWAFGLEDVHEAAAHIRGNLSLALVNSSAWAGYDPYTLTF